MAEDKASLLDPAFLRKLERLRIQARRAFPGVMRGERRSTRKGSSVEFSDFRKYEAGDDFRHVDWNIYARLERLVLRQFVEEEDVRIDILIDRSRSMHFGEPMTKFDFARRAAAALAFLAASSLDRFGVTAFDASVRKRMRPLRGRGHLLSVISFLENLEEKGEGAEAEVDEASGTNLSGVLRAYQKTTLRSGILFVISDFFDTSDFRAEMKRLAHRGFDLNLIQVLTREEITPEVVGDLLLVDSETGDERELTVNDRAMAAYRKALAVYTTELEDFSRRNRIGYTQLTVDIAFEDLLLKNLIESRMAQ
ncbi:MAG TPA: DUF58 domain-containing protein [Blastocatellia bacterium]|nr:DUF58 domain-containing protein [Blastocatellia bacterium]